MTPTDIRKRRTKIVATLGPASSSETVISELITSGVNVFRLNFSHGTHEQHRSNAKMVRELSQKHNRHVGILGDLQGPKIRIGELQTETLQLVNAEPLILTIDQDTADSTNGQQTVINKRHSVTGSQQPTTITIGRYWPIQNTTDNQ